MRKQDIPRTGSYGFHPYTFMTDGVRTKISTRLTSLRFRDTTRWLPRLFTGAMAERYYNNEMLKQ